jgi:hypothetical protein
VLGICGFVVCPLICSILAVIFGYQARGEIDRSGGAQGGRGLAVAGIVLGWIGIALSVLIGAIIAILAASGDLEEDDFYEDDFSALPTLRLVAAVARGVAPMAF